MMKNSIELRKNRYFKLSAQIAQLDNAQLHSLLANRESKDSGMSWGMNHVILMEESKVFLKRIPVTHVEYDNLFSTRNLYELPTAYNYGFGSTGFSIFRELVTHIKTTNWVLEGTIANFPLMYHYRIMPFSGQHTDMGIEQWDNNVNLRRYVADRSIANHELVLFLEYIPHVLETWLHSNPHKLQNHLNDIRRTIDFLRTQGIIHFDAHFRNILTDGEQTYLTDFGLVLDKSFMLTDDEASFFEQNRFYDYGEVLRNLGHLIRSPYEQCSAAEKHRIRQKYGIPEGLKLHEVGAMLLSNIELIHADGDMNLDEFYVASIVKYHSIITLMQDFFADMWGNAKKDTGFPQSQLQLLLKETEFSS